jgi:ABC-type lipoprotein export system ATPase subunit
VPRVELRLHTDVPSSARVVQIASLYDLQDTAHSTVEIDAELPLDEHDWTVGLIVGPSGCGKSSLARELFGKHVITGYDWPAKLPIVDAFPRDTDTRDVVGALTAVGFGTVPAWLRPYRVLSTGEQFRATVARALVEAPDPVVIDEFTSNVDRQAAKVASHAIQKAARRSQRRLVAVTCHYDVVDWLQPDWAYQPHRAEFTWRHLQPRPRVDLVIREVERGTWDYFRHHHYLSERLAPGAKCVGAFVDEEMVAFSSWLRYPHKIYRNVMKGHRLVVLPDWQGLGIGGALDDRAGQFLYDQGFRYRNTIAHPGMIAYYSRSPRWRELSRPSPRAGHSSTLRPRDTSLRLLVTRSFEYVPPAATAAA